MQKKWFSACLQHPGRPGVDHAAGPHSHSQLELGHPAPLREARSFQFATSPGTPYPLLLLFPTYSPIPLPAMQLEKGGWHVSRRGKDAEAPQGLGIRSTIHFLCTQRPVLLLFLCSRNSACPRHPRDARLSPKTYQTEFGVRCSSKVIHRQERTGPGSLMPIQCS